MQYAPRQIRANAILPGRVDTPLVVDDYATPDPREAFALSHPLRHFGTPEDIASLALYLAVLATCPICSHPYAARR